jgi:hypothetical protein
MYNMDISIFGFKLNLEVLILIGVIYLILVGHTLCGCSNYSLMEAFDVSGNLRTDISNNTIRNDLSGNLLTQNSNGSVGAAGALIHHAKNGPSKQGGRIGKEGFAGANINFGQSSPYDLTNNSIINTSSWSKPDMTVVPGQPLSQGVKDFLAREPQPIPLPEGEMFMFANTPFKPECCPNTYSTSKGCACMTSGQYNYLILRGGNNVPYSDF